MSFYAEALNRLLADDALAETIAKRLDARIDKSGGPESCWTYQKQRLPSGYGMMSVFSSRDAHGRQRSRANYAHRIAYVLHNRCLPEGGHVLHVCDNPPCANPAHLIAGTQKQNVADAIAKGRAFLSPICVATDPRRRIRYTNEQVLGILDLTAGGVRVRDICSRLGVSRNLVFRVRRDHRDASATA